MSFVVVAQFGDDNDPPETIQIVGPFVKRSRADLMKRRIIRRTKTKTDAASEASMAQVTVSVGVYRCRTPKETIEAVNEYLESWLEDVVGAEDGE